MWDTSQPSDRRNHYIDGPNTWITPEPEPAADARPPWIHRKAPLHTAIVSAADARLPMAARAGHESHAGSKRHRR